MTDQPIQLKVDPAKGRLMEIVHNGANLLWVNPKPEVDVSWPNWGGVKTWIWPQDAWPAKWPPLPAMDGLPWQQEDDSNTIASKYIEEFGVRLLQGCELNGEKVCIVSELRQEGVSAIQVAPWVVIQLPVPKKLWVSTGKVELAAGDEGKQSFDDNEVELLTSRGRKLRISSDVVEGYDMSLQLYLDPEGRYLEVEFAGRPKELVRGEVYCLTTSLEVI